AASSATTSCGASVVSARSSPRSCSTSYPRMRSPTPPSTTKRSSLRFRSLWKGSTLTQQVTSRTQFKACLASEQARRQLGLSLTDSQALQILANDDLTNDWYDWWLERPPVRAIGIQSEIEIESEVESPAITF